MRKIERIQFLRVPFQGVGGIRLGEKDQTEKYNGEPGFSHNKYLIDEAKTRYQSKNVEFIACDAISYLSESNSSFDIMICSHILEHLDNPSNFLSLFKSYFKNIYIEVPDADNTYMNLIRTNFGLSSMYTDDDHIYEFTREDLEKLVIENDMKIVESEFRYGVIKLWIET